MRRRPGTLLDLEAAILGVLVEASRSGHDLHGFAVAKQLADRQGAQRLTAHGTLYKALGRLEDGGLVESHWEDPAHAEGEGRPRRRLYAVTSAGRVALATHERPAVVPATMTDPGRVTG
jgi:DNA-binding PadR family transcriptional regulator